MFRVRLTAPPRLKPILGQTVFTQRLGTKDRREAEKRAYGVIADLRRRIDVAEKVLADEMAGDAGGGESPGPSLMTEPIEPGGDSRDGCRTVCKRHAKRISQTP